MAYIGESSNIMRPEKGSLTIKIPITFDYSGGRKESNKSKYLWVGILLVLGLIISIGIMTSDEGFFLVNILFGLAVFYGVLLIIRFPILKEHKIRNNMAKMLEEDYKLETRNFWGIYSIDDVYPYYAHLRNGKTALYVRFEKDVILGKVDEAEYEHYEAIGDAYNLAGSKNISMCHVDYMDNIGEDERLNECFKQLSYIENEDIRYIMTDIYSNLKEEMNDMVSTFDVYVFTFNTRESIFWNNIQEVIKCMLDANYNSFTILNSNDLRELTKSLFNIHDFSVNEAEATAFESRNYQGVIPISLEKPDGSEIIFNKTLEEKQEARLLKEKEEELRKEEKRRRKRNKKSNNSNKKEDIEIDIFD